MIYIGCHLSVTDGYEAMGKTMSRFGGNTFAWFTGNPRGGRTKPIVQEVRIFYNFVGEVAEIAA